MCQNNTFRTTSIPHRTKFGKPMTYYNDVIWYKTHSINPNITKYHLVLLTCSGIYVKMDLVFLRS
jgi:hypothetical protein